MRKRFMACALAAMMLLTTVSFAVDKDQIDPEMDIVPDVSVTVPEYQPETQNPDSTIASQPSQNLKTVAALPNTHVVKLDGKTVLPEGYNIENFNYFKLRDMAYLLSGKTCQFDIGYDDTVGAINIIAGKAYTVAGGEMSPANMDKQSAYLSTMTVLRDGKPVSIKAYNIRGNTYYKLRDMGEVVGFGVDFDSKSGTAFLKTPEPPKPPKPEPPKPEPPKPEPSKPEPSKPEPPKRHHIDGKLTILIDVGHGGKDNGSDGIASEDFINFRGEQVKAGDTIYEKDFNLPVALKLRDLLENAGATVHISREDDRDQSPSDRKKIIAKYADKLDLCISVHHNAYNTKAKGAEVWAQYKYKKGGPGKDLANSIVSEYRAINRTLRGVRFQESSSRPGQDRMYMLRYPAEYDVLGIISEYCFVDNEDDQKAVFGEDKLNEEAKALADGILNFFKDYEY